MGAALSLWQVLETNPLLAPDVFSYTALITAYGKAGRWDEAQQCFDDMSARGAAGVWQGLVIRASTVGMD